jgi:predicted transcriptional regulator
MPNSPREGRRQRAFRVDDVDWEALGQVADQLDLDRGWVLRQLVRAFLEAPEDARLSMLAALGRQGEQTPEPE